jgi:hypothetical protein
MANLRSERLKTLAGAVLFAAVGLFVLSEAATFSRRGAMLPLVVGYGMLLLGALLAVVGWRTAPGDDVAAGDGSLKRRWLFTGVLALWVAAIPYLGFFGASVVGFLVVALIVPREDRWTVTAVLRHLAGAVLASGAMTLLFAGLLGVPLPEGRLW